MEINLDKGHLEEIQINMEGWIQQDRSTCGRHKFYIQTPIEVIFTSLEISRCVEQHKEDKKNFTKF
jgi:hypothetical protein